MQILWGGRWVFIPYAINLQLIGNGALQSLAIESNSQMRDFLWDLHLYASTCTCSENTPVLVLSMGTAQSI